MSAGMAYEAMNNAGAMDSRLIVVLNDNDMSIAPPVGALSAYLSRLLSGKTYRGLRESGKQIARKMPRAIFEHARRAEELARGFFTGGTLFEQLGFYYVGPIDGHNLGPPSAGPREREDVRARPDPGACRHAQGQGLRPGGSGAGQAARRQRLRRRERDAVQAEGGRARLHQGVRGEPRQRGAHGRRVVAVTAAMPAGTGLDAFANAFPDRFFDVGIAEQHAVTFAAGLAAEGMKPFCAIYSTFLQRAYDQIAHDVALQRLPVRFAIDRAGLVGADGPTHAGAYDLAYLGCLPNMVLMAPADEVELVHMVATAVAYDGGPIAFRYPRGEGLGLELPERGQALEIGRGRIMREGSRVALLSLGTRLNECLKAAEELSSRGLSTTVVDARFAKPLDTMLIDRLAKEHELLLTIEEGSAGGFGSQVLAHLAEAGALDRGLRVRAMTLPDRFVDHDKPESQYATVGLNARAIVLKVLDILPRISEGRNRAASNVVRQIVLT